nr:Wzz/FepE/Etk N-terminal domain-containing protein [uncultured Alistipes sp.]
MEETQSSGTTAEEIDLLDLMKKIWARRIFVLKAAGIGAIAGLIIAFSIPKEYTTTVKMAPEGINATKGGGMADLAALAGFDLSSGSGNNVDGINLMLYPDVVNSTPFMVDLSQIPVQGKKMPATMSLYDYVDTQLSSPWWKYLLAVPGKIIGWISFAEKEEEANGINPYALTQQQSEVLKKQNERINISVDKKTGVITASATMQDPLVTAAVADSMVNKLQEYILTYRTEKAVRDLAFTRNLFDEAKQKYYDAQRKYAIAADANKHIAKQTAQVELDRLQNEQQLAFGVYNHLAQQLETAKIKVQEQTPCVTIIEPATVPVKKSNTSKVIILIAFVFLGACAGIGKILVKDLFLKKTTQA